MNRDEHILNRLLKAARRSPRELPDAMPFSTGARILADWRSSVPEKETAVSAGIFRRAAICGVLIMIASLGWSRWNDSHQVPGAMAFVNLAKAIEIAP